MRGVAPAAVLLLCWSAVAFAADTAAPAFAADAVAPAQNQRDALPNPLAAQSMEGLSATIDRPLFSPSRRAPAAPAAPAAEAPAPPSPPAPPPNVVLVGIVMDGESARAVIRAGAEKKIMRARIGDDVDGWKVSQIEGRKLVLSLDDRHATFTMFNRDGEQRPVNAAATPNALDRPDNPPQSSQPQQNPSTANSNTNNPRKRRRGRE
jgi:general secretion pathway protein N